MRSDSALWMLILAMGASASCNYILGLESIDEPGAGGGGTTTDDGSGGAGASGGGTNSGGGSGNTGGGGGGCDPCAETVMTHELGEIPYAMSVDSQGNVYWTYQGTPTTGGVMQKVGEAAPTLLAIGRPSTSALGLYVEGTDAFWTADDGIWRASLTNAGGDGFQINMDASAPIGIFADGTHVYWTEFGSNKVMRAERPDGTAVTTLASDTSNVGDPEPDVANGPSGVAVMGQDVYWVNSNDGTLRVLSGGVDTTLANQGNPAGIAIDGGYVYWTILSPGDKTKGAVKKINIQMSPAGQPITVADDQKEPRAIAVKNNHVFWINTGEGDNDGSVVMAQADTEMPPPPRVLASGQRKPAGIAVTDKHVYWSNAGDSTIMRVEIPVD